VKTTMMDLAPNTPIIVGIGFRQEKNDDPTQCSEAYRLMVDAARDAADDAGSSELLRQIESISVTQGLWLYPNPGKLIGEALGCPSARSIVAGLGVLQLMPLDDLCRAIAAGEQHLGLVTGGEAKYRALRATITQTPLPDTEQDESTPPPDVRHTSPDPVCSDLENLRGLQSPIALFAVIESALRHHQGLSVEEHRDALARLYSGFSKVAASNPHAWSREPVAAEDIRDATPRNAMQAFPYTARHCSQWNVNRAVAILVCSARKAQQLGLPSANWIFPVAAVESKHVVVLAQQRRLYSHPGTIMAGARALELAGASTRDVTAAELYSCFPAAIQSFALDLRLETDCPLSVTGAMPFAGGPFNHFSLEGVARMVEVLRSDKANAAPGRRVGLVSNLSGIFGKQACALFSNLPNPRGYGFEDITAAVAARDTPLPLNGDYVGAATIVGYTVVFEKGQVSHGVAVCDTPNGERTVARNDDAALLDEMMKREFCGCVVEISKNGTFSSPAVKGE
jgi:acetyl-CoA C-acetyltransferase